MEIVILVAVLVAVIAAGVVLVALRSRRGSGAVRAHPSSTQQAPFGVDAATAQNAHKQGHGYVS